MKRLLIYLIISVAVLPVFVHAQDWQLIASGEGDYLQEVFFINKTIGWAVGNSETILSTTDGGYHWTSHHPIDNANYRDVWFTDENTGWIIGTRVGANLLLSTVDGGNTWKLDTFVLSGFHDIQFVSKDTGWIVGGNTFDGLILKTTNAGIDWVLQGTDLFGSFIGGGSFINGQTGWIGGGESYFDNFENAIVYRTDDGGKTWTNQHVNKIGPLYSIAFSDDASGIIGGRGGSMRTTNGGQTWESTGLPETHLISMIDNKHVHFRSYDMFYTSDLGQSWIEVAKPDGGGINGLFFLDTLTGWGVGGTKGNWDVWRYNPGNPSQVDPQNEISAQSLANCYPNPVGVRSGHGTSIRFPFFSPNLKRGSVIVLNSLGKSVFFNEISNETCTDRTIKLDVNQYHSGVYMAIIVVDGSTYRQSFVVMN